MKVLTKKPRPLLDRGSKPVETVSSLLRRFDSSDENQNRLLSINFFPF
jgi:hypothetical protein